MIALTAAVYTSARDAHLTVSTVGGITIYDGGTLLAKGWAFGGTWTGRLTRTGDRYTAHGPSEWALWAIRQLARIEAVTP